MCDTFRMMPIFVDLASSAFSINSFKADDGWIKQNKLRTCHITHTSYATHRAPYTSHHITSQNKKQKTKTQTKTKQNEKKNKLETNAATRAKSK